MKLWLLIPLFAAFCWQPVKAQTGNEVHSSQAVCPASTSPQVWLFVASSVGTVAGMPVVLTKGVCAQLGAGLTVSTSPGSAQPTISASGASNGPQPVQVDNEEVAGTTDGTNLVFTFATAPIVGSQHVYLNGLRMLPLLDYTISGAALTFMTYQTPPAGSIVVADYRHN